MNIKNIIGWSILAIMLIAFTVNMFITDGWSGVLAVIIVFAVTGLARLAIELIKSS